MLLGTSQKRLLILLLIAAALLNIAIVLPHHSTIAYNKIYKLNDFERQVQQINPGQALVFLAPDPASGQAPTRNTLDFQSNIIYALDRGEENSLLMETYPGRRYFLYQYDPKNGRAVLREISPDRVY